MGVSGAQGCNVDSAAWWQEETSGGWRGGGGAGGSGMKVKGGTFREIAQRDEDGREGEEGERSMRN